jgi:hypothetical protein
METRTATAGRADNHSGSENKTDDSQSERISAISVTIAGPHTDSISATIADTESISSTIPGPLVASHGEAASLQSCAQDSRQLRHRSSFPHPEAAACREALQARQGSAAGCEGEALNSDVALDGHVGGGVTCDASGQHHESRNKDQPCASDGTPDAASTGLGCIGIGVGSSGVERREGEGETVGRGTGSGGSSSRAARSLQVSRKTVLAVTAFTNLVQVRPDVLAMCSERIEVHLWLVPWCQVWCQVSRGVFGCRP